MNHGIVESNPTNDPASKPVRTRSQFKPGMSLYQTLCFGLASPSFAMEVVPDDRKVSVRCTTDLDTMSLKSPMMSPLKMHRDYFFVPNRAILRQNSDLLITNPLTGEDIVAGDVNSLLKLSSAWMTTFLNNHITPLYNILRSNSSNDYAQKISAILYVYGILAPIFSDGSLLNITGVSLSKLLDGAAINNYVTTGNAKQFTFDESLEAMLQWLHNKFYYFKVVLAKYQDATSVQSFQTYVYRNVDSDASPQSGISLRELLEMIRDGWVVAGVDNLYYAVDSMYPNKVTTYYDNQQVEVYLTTSFTGWQNLKPRNIQRLVAYQLACAQFYTSDSVDYVYNTALWHDNMRSLIDVAFGGRGNTPTYTLNGVEHEFDVVSSVLLNGMLNQMFAGCSPYTSVKSDNSYYGWNRGANDVEPSIAFAAAYSYFVNLFQAQRSLKYRDYFVGCKPRPMAVGDVNVNVNNSQVNVVDVTKNIQIQRFLNQVNRIGRNLKEYSRGIFGQSPLPDPHDCVWLGSTSDAIGAEETNNTGSDQLSLAQSTTSKFRLDSSRFAFEFDVAENGVVIAITTFDVPRPYVNVTDRACFHQDRFDMFNPFMQNIGDQEVFSEELSPDRIGTFGYAIRYSEYHQRVSRAVGGFRNFLPGFAFVADNHELGVLSPASVISPDFIRSRPFELDRFYVSLTGYSPAAYFHFITRQDYEVSASRPMEAAPSIL